MKSHQVNLILAVFRHLAPLCVARRASPAAVLIGCILVLRRLRPIRLTGLSNLALVAFLAALIRRTLATATEAAKRKPIDGCALVFSVRDPSRPILRKRRRRTNALGTLNLQ